MSDPHKFAAKVCHWDYCIKCGLVALRNDATAQAIKLGCNWAALMARKTQPARGAHG